MIYILLLSILLILAAGVMFYFVQSNFWGLIFIVGAIILLMSLILQPIKSKITKLKKSLINVANIQYRKVIQNIVEHLTIKINKWKCEEDRKEISLLSPIKDIKRLRPYIELIKSAVDNPDAHNIAITGIYGSGKSSILRSFLACYSRYNAINVSLASFLETNTKECSGNPDKHFEEQLEYSILQQLFYQVSARKIPCSRFGRIERLSYTHRIFNTILYFTIIIVGIYIFKVDWIWNLLKIKPSENLEWLYYIALGIFVICMLLFIYKCVIMLNKISIKTLKLSKATLEIEDKKNVSVMNRYMDEILYLFQERGFEIVVFEDIDRFGGTQIFTKLRELNVILNNSEEIKHKVVFIYALRDDIFANETERTKFFDYIVPVIPYVNVSNSANIFCRKFKGLKISEDKLPELFIADISIYVNDMRVITNMVTEFQIYRGLLDHNLKLTNLLAIILYKNLYPTDFALLHQNKGIVYETFESKDEMIVVRREKLEKIIEEIDEQIEVINAEFLCSIKELQSVVIAALVKVVGVNINNFQSVSKRYNYNDLYDDNAIKSILAGQMYYYSSYDWTPITRKQIIDELGENFDYDKRVKLIQLKLNPGLRNLQTSRSTYVRKRGSLYKTTLVDLYKTGTDIFSIVAENHSGEKNFDKNYAKLKSLLEKGYIDEKYFFYISIFQEGRLTPHDQEFVSGLKFGVPKSENYILEEPKSIISSYLTPPDYDNPKILNYSLLDYMLEHEMELGDKCDAVLEHIVGVSPFNIDFVYDYLRVGKQGNAFVKRLSALSSSLWSEAFNDAKHIDKEMDNLLKIILNKAEINNIKDLNGERSFSDYLNDNRDYANFFKGMDFERQKQLLDIFALKVRWLDDDSSEQNTYQYLLENNGYEWTIENIRIVLIHAKVSDKFLKEAPYNTVMNSGVKYIEKYAQEDINNFMQNIVCSEGNIKEPESSVIEILNDEKVDLNNKIALIKLNETKVEKVQNVNEPTLRTELYKANKVLVSYNNIIYYLDDKGTNQVDDLLVTYMNSNKIETMNVFSELEEVATENVEKVRSIVLSGIMDEIASTILGNKALRNVWSDSITDLSSIRIHFLINKHLLEISQDLFVAVGQKHPSLLIPLLCEYSTEILKNLERYTFSADVVIMLCESPKFSGHSQELIEMLKADDIKTSQQGDFILKYYVTDGSGVKQDLLLKALEISTNDTQKMITFKEYIEREFLQPTNIDILADKMGEPFTSLKDEGGHLVLAKSQESESLINVLRSKGFVGKVIESDNNYKARVLKRKK